MVTMQTTKQVIDYNRNPTGRGGFGDNPQNRNDGRWNKEDSISYQYNKLIRMSVEEFKKWEEENPEDKRTVAQELAYEAIKEAKYELKYLKEVTDRTEGAAPSRLEIEGKVQHDHILTYERAVKLLEGEDVIDGETIPKLEEGQE